MMGKSIREWMVYIGLSLIILASAYRVYVVYHIGYWPLLLDHYGPNGECISPGAPITWILVGLGVILILPYAVHHIHNPMLNKDDVKEIHELCEETDNE